MSTLENETKHFKSNNYEGEYQNGWYHGQGEYTFADGIKYIGRIVV